MITSVIVGVIIFKLVIHNETLIIFFHSVLSSYFCIRMFLIVTFIWILIHHVHTITSLDCEYSSREYQVVLRPDLLVNSFDTGVTRILDELTKIENAKIIQFKVSKSSLQFKNVSLVNYIPGSNRDSNDFYIPPIFKSRRKATTEPADIVTKISNPDPALACVPLTVYIFFFR
jgi:hypothetical protein